MTYYVRGILTGSIVLARCVYSRTPSVRVAAAAFLKFLLEFQASSDAMQVFINSFPKSAEYISAYVDTKLRKSVSSASDTLGDASLDDILQIFRYLPLLPLCLAPVPITRYKYNLFCTQIRQPVTCLVAA